MTNNLDPDQARRFIGPDLIPNSVSKGYQQKKRQKLLPNIVGWSQMFVLANALPIMAQL